MVDQFNMTEVLAKQQFQQQQQQADTTQAQVQVQPPVLPAPDTSSPDIMGIVANALLKNPGKARELLDDLDGIDPSLRPMVIEIVKSKYPAFSMLIDRFAGGSDEDDDDGEDGEYSEPAPDDDDMWDEALAYARQRRSSNMAYGDICERVRWKYGIDWQPAKLQRLLMRQDESVTYSDTDTIPHEDTKSAAVRAGRLSRHAERMKKLADENQRMKEAVARQSVRFTAAVCVIAGGVLGFLAGKLL